MQNSVLIPTMDPNVPLPLLGNLTPAQFMKRHWHKKPLLVRAAAPGMASDTGPAVSRSELFALAARDDVESRLVQLRDGQWSLKRGPLSRRALPPVSRPQWTLLVQGMDLHVQPVHELQQAFRFVPDARLDDLMISWASAGGGVGPHFDSYDVFLLQAQGRRRWRIGRQASLALRDDVPLRILRNFTPEQEFVLEPGDMLYLPPRWAHDGVALDECQTWSIGFRASAAPELGRELLQRLSDRADDLLPADLYRDPAQPATATPAQVPAALAAFASRAVQRLAQDPQTVACVLGEYLSEPKPQVWFEPAPPPRKPWARVQLDRRTRMLWDARHIFINGESFVAGGRDARLLRELADRRCLQAADLRSLSADASQALQEWCGAGWVHAWPAATASDKPGSAGRPQKKPDSRP